ncbi:MAG TPA: hypothetical protein PKO24_06175 [Methanomassiliicoccales archaeon]|nr:hypothetical protein [Methanomassiliicoccales archaeon]HQM66333.1 hypothetical protein [Methanomassiliicoccales archaeon]
MEVLGLCSLCSKPARYSCSLCGRPVCLEHFDRYAHLCYHCSPDKKDERRHRKLPDRRLLG